MIDHKNKIIFIHIPRTGGTSLESALVGKDWYNIHGSTKHLTASQSKTVYKEYWDDYIKISIVRNPWDRVISLFTCRHQAKYCKPYKNSLSYFLQYYKPASNEQPYKQCCEILDEPIDCIFQTATLEKSFNKFCQKRGINAGRLASCEKTEGRKDYRSYYNDKTKEHVARIWKDDIKEYNFKF